MPQHNAAIAIKYDRVRERPARVTESPRQTMGGALADQNRITDRHALHELRDVGRIVDRDANKLHAFGLVLRTQGNKIRYFFAAWRTPAGPEIQDDDLSTPLRQCLFMPMRIRKTELPQPGDSGRCGHARRIPCLGDPDACRQRGEGQRHAIQERFLHGRWG